MNILKFDNANSLYYGLMDAIEKEVHHLIEGGRNPVFALPTGNTMIPLYRLATENEEKLSINRWTCFGLDEYYPIQDQNRTSSFSAFMDKHFYGRLQKGVLARKMLTGETSDPEKECELYEKQIQEAGGIDIAILGLGINAHIAFNEPGSQFSSRTRLVDLHPQTLLVNFQGKQIEQKALTMGIGTILESKKIYVVALGKSKANSVKCAILERDSRSCPASALQRHSQVTWFLDSEAGSGV